jgi:NodT family efflux transporter outer membrane factor (OMF) lipoprotein
VDAAEADLSAAGASLDDVKASLAAEVALAYVDLRLQEARYAIALKNLASQSETLELTGLRNRAGLANGLDVARAESRVAETRALVPVYVEGRENAANRLDLLLGLAPGALREELRARKGVPRVPSAASAGIPAEALRRRPDVRAAERRLAAATSRTAQAEAALLPAFTLSGGIGLVSSSISSLLDARALTASFVRGLAAPIFDRRKIRQQIEIQDAIAEQALADYETTILAALSETENAFLALDGSRARQEALDSGVASARTAADLARKTWSTGLSDLDSVLDAERSLLAFEESLARSRADEISAFVRLSKALGGGPAPSTPARTKERRNG